MSAPVQNAVSGGGTGQRQCWRVAPPPEDGWERFPWIVFISTSLMPDLTSGLKGVSRVRQKCGESEHWSACASVSGARTCVPHVVLRCSAVVQAARRSPRSINHTYHLCACVTLEPTPATNQHRWGRRGDVLMVSHVRAHTCEHVPARRREAGGGVEVSIEERRT